MRAILTSLGFVLAMLAGATAHAQGMRAHPAAKVIQGPAGERVTIVFLEPRAKGELLIKFQGVDGVWENRVFRHQRVVFGKNRENYELLDGRDDPNYVSVVHRESAYDVFPKGSTRAPLRMVRDEAESKAVDTAALVNEYLRTRR